MKGIQGLIVAAGLGITGALFCWLYLANKAKEIEMISFIGVKPGVVVRAGDVLKPDDLVEVPIPKNAVGNLKDFAFQWDQKGSVANFKTWRTLTDEVHPSLVLIEDLKTPQKTLDLAEGETVWWIPVDSRTFVPSLVKPGDWVSFQVPTMRGAGLPTPASETKDADVLQPKPDETQSTPAPIVTGSTEIMGKFKVLSVGNRLGDPEILRSSKAPQHTQENVLGIRVSSRVAGETERAAKLWDRLQAVNFRQIGIILHGKP